MNNYFDFVLLAYVVNVFIASNFKDLPGLTYVFLGHSLKESWYMTLLLNASNVVVYISDGF